jgi:hypothetical protein
VDYTHNTRTKFLDICNAALKGFKSKRDDAKHSGRHVHVVDLPPLIYATSLQQPALIRRRKQSISKRKGNFGFSGDG